MLWDRRVGTAIPQESQFLGKSQNEADSLTFPWTAHRWFPA